MPIVDGYAFLDEVRSLHAGPAPTILVASASPDVRRLASLGSVRVLAKPFDVGKLLDEVRLLAGPPDGRAN